MINLWKNKKQEKKLVREVFFDEYISTPQEKNKTKKEEPTKIIVEDK